MKPDTLFKYLIINLLVATLSSGYGQQAVPYCGTADSVSDAYIQKLSKQVDLTKARANAGEMLEYRLGIDVDYKTAMLYGQNQEKIRSTIYRIFAEASAIFEREMNIKLTVNHIHIWQEPEPYDLKTDFDYFYAIGEYWNRNRHEERDAVVSVSVRSGMFLGGYRLCTSNFPAPDNRFNVDVLTHELGHTLGSPHTHSCYWPGGPIDRCSGLEDPTELCPPSRQEFLNGSIMSYCRSKLTFHPLCRNLIRKFAEGEVNPSFSLKPYNEKPFAPGVLAVLGSQGNTTGFMPSFEWYPSPRTAQYRFQIAKDETFSQVVEDTLVNQSFFQSVGQNKGTYFARYQPENSLGSSGWSMAVNFRVGGFSESALPPPLQRVTRESSGIVSGSFKSLEGISSYQLRLENPYDNVVHERTEQVNSTGMQSFSVTTSLQNDLLYSLRYRVNKQGIWSRWSVPVWLETPLSTRHVSIDSTLVISTKPVLALRQWVPLTIADAFAGQMEIATDASFKNIVFQRSFSNNAVGDWCTDKELFFPSLHEHTTYFTRSRMLLSNQIRSAWTVSKFVTGVFDSRFRFLGTPSKVLHNGSFSGTMVLYNRFLKAGDHLYVFNYQGGYHRTTDLQSWQTHLPSTTNGRSPMILRAFGASPDGKTFTADPYQGFALKTGDTFEWISPPTPINWNDTETMVYSDRSGFFIKNFDKGIIRYHNGNFHYYREAIQLGIPNCIAKDNQERVWTVDDSGAVWRFENEQWTRQPSFPIWQGVYGMVFDKNDYCYVYGDFGVFKLDVTAGRWDAIKPLQQLNVRKLIFDEEGAMWLASYRFTPDHQGMEKFALIKYSNGKVSVYSDGLNFLREPFDIEYFKGQLVIMTTGGEIHTFDERQILTLTPQPAYCTGQQLDLTLTTNSTFAPDNRITVELRQSGSDKTIRWEVPTPASHRLSVNLPETLSQGRYTLSIHTTNPEINSYESAPFDIYPLTTSVKPVIERNQSLLKITPMEGYQYQWLLNDVPLLGATGPSVVANQDGIYSVTATNPGGCIVTSEALPVELGKPGELTLMQNKPNPLGASGDILFYLPKAESIRLDLFNLRGQKIAELKSGDLPEGWHTANVNGMFLSSGIYVYRLKAGNITKSLKMIRN